MSAGVLAAVLPFAQSASAGTTGGSATAQAADVVLFFDGLDLGVLGNSQQLAVGPTIGEQTVSGSLDLTGAESANSSVVATSTSGAVARTSTGVLATATVEGLQLTLAGTTVASATVVTAGASCPVDASGTAEAQVNGLRLGDAAPVDLSAGQTSSGSTTITDAGGQTYPVELTAEVVADSDASDGEAHGLRVQVTIDRRASAPADFAITMCQRPEAGSDEPGPMAPGPEGPDGGLADSGTDSAVVATLLGVVLVAGGGSVLLWTRRPGSRRSDPR